jgi:hypothetical protein
MLLIDLKIPQPENAVMKNQRPAPISLRVVKSGVIAKANVVDGSDQR